MTISEHLVVCKALFVANPTVGNESGPFTPRLDAPPAPRWTGQDVTARLRDGACPSG